MHPIRKIAAVSLTALALSPAFAAAEREDLNYDAFVKMCDTNKDGMLSKQEIMKHVEKTFDKVDQQKKGELDRKQLEAFLRELMKSGG